MGKGRSIGVVFAEIGLDSTEYDKAAQKILIKTQEVSRSAETNFKELGSHSDAIFNAMRQNIMNSFDMIVGSSCPCSRPSHNPVVPFCSHIGCADIGYKADRSQVFLS